MSALGGLSTSCLCIAHACHCLAKGLQGCYGSWLQSVLRSQNYLFSAPTPPLSLILAAAPAPNPVPAPALAPAIYCHLKLFFNRSTLTMEVKIRFSSSYSTVASFKLTAVNIYIYKIISTPAPSQIFSAPMAPAPQH